MPSLSEQIGEAKNTYFENDCSFWKALGELGEI